MTKWAAGMLGLLLAVTTSQAGGSIGWDEVSARLKTECPALLAAIDGSFEMARVGGAARLGPRSVDVMEGRAGVGRRVPPYEFRCRLRGAGEEYPYEMVIEESGEWSFTVKPASR